MHCFLLQLLVLCSGSIWLTLLRIIVQAIQAIYLYFMVNNHISFECTWNANGVHTPVKRILTYCHNPAQGEDKEERTTHDLIKNLFNKI